MIASSRKYPFGSRVTTMHTSSFTCMVSTAKEGLFKPQSTMVFEMPKGQLEPRRAVAKIIYTQSLLASDRLQMHDAICKMLDESGETMPLGEAVATCSSFLKRRGVVTEVVNLALSPFTDLL